MSLLGLAASCTAHAPKPSESSVVPRVPFAASSPSPAIHENGIAALNNTAQQAALRIAEVAILPGSLSSAYGKTSVGNEGAISSNRKYRNLPNISLQYSSESHTARAQIVGVLGLNACNSITLDFSVSSFSANMLQHVEDVRGQLDAHDFATLFATPDTTLLHADVQVAADKQRLEGQVSGNTLSIEAYKTTSAYADVQTGLEANQDAFALVAGIHSAQQALYIGS
jgi:hypothetical protein